MDKRFKRWLKRKFNLASPLSGKGRLGVRGAKKRHSVFKAEQNQLWLPLEEEELKTLCEKHGADYETFLNPKDNPNVKWGLAQIRAYKDLRPDLRFPVG